MKIVIVSLLHLYIIASILVTGSEIVYKATIMEIVYKIKRRTILYIDASVFLLVAGIYATYICYGSNAMTHGYEVITAVLVTALMPDLMVKMVTYIKGCVKK